MRVAAAAGGCLLLVLLPLAGPPPVGLAVLLALPFLVLVRLERARLQRATVSVLTFGVLLTAVHDANYLMLPLALDRLHDPALKAVDVAIYERLWPGSAYEAIFPLLRDSWLLGTLESAYVSLSFQPPGAPRVVALAWTRTTLSARGGSVLYRRRCGLSPLSGTGSSAVRPERRSSGVQEFAKSFHYNGAGDIEAVRAGLPAASGLGYFVALPNLHAALAVVCQAAMRSHPVLFWMAVPWNVMLLLATCVLGQHYILDTLAGVIVGSVAWQFSGRSR
jgi:membrane-associated phospholipid phosphatase